jgi:competence protein ComFA
MEGDLAQVIIFVPTINLSDKVAEEIQKALLLPPFNNFEGDWVNFSHSKDPERDKKVKDFAEGKFPVFVTTTIMERGITLPRINIIVLFADADRIFDKETLVQMAGRSGRLEQYPVGRVWYIAEKTTAAMNEAVHWIQDMNNHAEKMGCLKNNWKSVIKNAE